LRARPQKPGFPLQFVRCAPEFRCNPLREQPNSLWRAQPFLLVLNSELLYIAKDYLTVF
jgi:hypothetical protein